MKVFHSRREAQEFSSSFPPSESLLLAFLTPGRTMRLLDQGEASGRPHHLLVVAMDEARNHPDRGSNTLEVIGTDGVWDIVFSRKSHHEVPGGHGTMASLEQAVEREAVLVEPAITRVEGHPLSCGPRRKAAGSPVTQAVCEERAELDGPFAKCFMTDLKAARVRPFLNILATQRKMGVQPGRRDERWS